MNLVLVGARKVVADARHVSIDMAALRAFAKSMTEGEFVESEFGTGSFLEAVTVEEQLAFTLVYSALNFCFWGLPKWAVKADEGTLDGSFGLFHALKRGVKNGLLPLSAEGLANLPQRNLRAVLVGNVEIPLFAARLTAVREIGRILTQRYAGSLESLLQAGNFDCLKIAQLLASEFPLSFGDTMLYQGKSVPFLKKAQLFLDLLFDLERTGVFPYRFSGYRELTALAGQRSLFGG